MHVFEKDTPEEAVDAAIRCVEGNREGLTNDRSEESFDEVVKNLRRLRKILSSSENVNIEALAQELNQVCLMVADSQFDKANSIVLREIENEKKRRLKEKNIVRRFKVGIRGLRRRFRRAA